MAPSTNEQPKMDNPGELDVGQLRKELLQIGSEKFSEKYAPLTFLVSVSQAELDANLYAYSGANDLDSYDFDTMENPPMPNALDGSSGKKVCYAVTKSDRNTFASKITVGRSRKNDIVLRSQSISKLHAALIPGEKEDWQIADMGSTNGTKLNEEKLYKNMQVELISGDIVSFASLSFRFVTWNDFHKILLEAM